MKKIAGLGIGLAVLLAVAGFSFAELGEYSQVFRNRVNGAVHDRIPMSVDIDRMEVLIRKLDQQVESQKYLVAKANISLQDARMELQQKQSVSEGLLTEMRHLRGWLDTSSYATIQVGCHEVGRDDISTALRHKLAAWKEATATAEACAETVAQHEQACDALNHQFTEWQSQRQLLTHRLEKLKAQYLTQQMKQESTPALDQSDLARATELADSIEKELRVAEAQAALGTTPLDQILSDQLNANTEDVEAEVDAILGKKREPTTRTARSR
ncbi:hypothetical protein [Rubinisphaera margarita]|uniref:hypothetical protein n=1 Tax=Rubinisphaera margarita TaxID=2909586 RepID=UPI001EE8D3B7|nr:hypothetical protein [Rubinisphaera margarita]MCG6155107.1 hypothetical protein [Rubinisphaera margarita]